MTDAPDRAAIRRRARERAERMGHRVATADAQAPADPDTGEEPLPTTNPGALAQLLRMGRLTPGQADRARRLFAAARQFNTAHTEGDAA